MPQSKTLRAKTKPAGSVRRWLWRGVLLLLLLLILPIFQAGCVRWVDPPITSLMLVRKAEAAIAKRKQTTQHEWLAFNRIPRDFLSCALMAEDQRFFQHAGFDWNEVRAARKEAERRGKNPRGASTITMQCARSVFLWQGRSWVRKGLEVYYTFWMEQFLPKKRILELYANSVELGPGVFGIKAASQAHFGLPVEKLSRNQCIRLAALLPAPLTWDPHRPSPRYQRRIQRLEQTFPQTRIPGWSSTSAARLLIGPLVATGNRIVLPGIPPRVKEILGARSLAGAERQRQAEEQETHDHCPS